MRKSSIIVLASIVLSSQVLASQDAGTEVQRDMCSARVMTSMIKENYRIKCMNLGETSIDKLLKAGYRVTATVVAPGSDKYEVELALFVEKAGK